MYIYIYMGMCKYALLTVSECVLTERCVYVPTDECVCVCVLRIHIPMYVRSVR